MPDLELKVDPRQLAAVTSLLERLPRALPRVMQTSINSTLTTLRSRTVRAIARRAAIKQKVVRGDTIVLRATRRQWAGAIRLLGRRIPIRDLSARQTKKGVTFRGPGGRRKLIPGAFVATMRSGHTGVFARKGRARLPIRELRGPSLAGIWEREEGLVNSILAYGQGILHDRIDQKVRWQLEKRGIA